VRERREEVERFRAELELVDLNARARGADRDDLYSRLTRMYGLMWADAIIAWAQAAEKELEQAASEKA
jgi:Virulence activator alpha C-term